MVNDIIFNVLSWSECNEIDDINNNNTDDIDNADEYGNEQADTDEQNDDRYIIRLFGRTLDDKTVFVKVINFTPYFYVEIPERWKITDVRLFVDYLKSRVKEKNKIDYSENLIDFDIVERHKFYGFTAGKLFKFLRLFFNNSNSMKKFTYILNEKIRLPRIGLNYRKLKIYEYNIDPMLRCMHIRNLLSCGWIKINKYTPLIGISNTDISITAHFRYLHPLDSNDVSNIKIMSFDIECTSEDGTFPQAIRKNDKIISIGSTFSRYGNPDCYFKNIITLGTCDPIPDVEVLPCKTEVDVLMEWKKLIHRENPDIITGFNIVGFDEKYIYDRAVKLGCNARFCSLSRLLGEQCNFLESSSTTKAFGKNEVKQYDMTGRIHIDLLKHMFKSYNLPSYKLDYVAEHFIRGNIIDYKIENGKTIFTITGIKDLSIENYICLEDSNGDKYLDGKKYKITDMTTSTITVNDILELITSEINTKLNYKWCLAKDDVKPDEIFSMQKGSSADRAVLAKYCVQDCALCNRLLAKLDIITNQIAMANVCHVPLSYIISRGQGIKIFSLVAKTCRLLNYVIPVIKKGYVKGEKEENDKKDSWYEGATVLTPDPGFYKDPIPVLDYASLYPSSMIHKNISHESLVLFFEYDNLPEYIYYDVEYVNEDGTKTNCRYAKHKDGTRGILPQILTTLLTERRQTKKIMENEIDPLKISILDGKQLALKITANSLYGQTGAPTSQIYLKTIAASTTATGREMLMTAKSFAEEQFNDIIHSVIDYDGIDMYQECMKNIIGNISNNDKEIIELKIDDKITEDNKMEIKHNFKKVLREFCKNRKGNIILDVGNKTIGLRKDLIVKNADIPIDNKTGFLISTKFRIMRMMENKYTMEAKTVYGDTDSIFVNMNVSNKETNEHLTDHSGLVKSMNLGILCGDLINQILPVPHNLEYEKTFWPFLITSKKRYVGNLYEFDPNKYYQKSMGIELKRRDNAKIVKKIVGNIIQVLLNEMNPEKAVLLTKKAINNLMCGKYPMSDFIITKTLKANYADRTRNAHVVLADRMAARDPGSKPQVNERIPYIYVEINEKKGKKILQGNRIEHPDYIKKNKLRIDYLFYLTNQVMNPAIRMLTHVTKNPSLMFTECINKENNRRSKLIPLTNWITSKKISESECLIESDTECIVKSNSDND